MQARDPDGGHIFLVKHGETEENRLGIHQGRGVGGEISERGAADVSRVGEAFAHAWIAADQLITSPMRRCRDSARLLHNALQVDRIVVDERLAAKDSGYLAGQRRELAAVEAEKVNVPIHQLRTPGGESSEDVQHRYLDLWKALCSQTGSVTVAVGHGGGIASLLLWLTGNNFDRYPEFVPASGATTWIEVAGSTPHIRCTNVLPDDLDSYLVPTG